MVVDGDINRAVSLGCLGKDVSIYKYQPRAEMINVRLVQLGEHSTQVKCIGPQELFVTEQFGVCRKYFRFKSIKYFR